eukprot:3431043-Alexandrium_andersonii.AAC.2
MRPSVLQTSGGPVGTPAPGSAHSEATAWGLAEVGLHWGPREALQNPTSVSPTEPDLARRVPPPA